MTDAIFIRNKSGLRTDGPPRDGGTQDRVVGRSEDA